MELTREDFEIILDNRLDKHAKRLEVFITDFILAENTRLVNIIQETIVQPMERRFERIELRLDRVEAKLNL